MDKIGNRGSDSELKDTSFARSRSKREEKNTSTEWPSGARPSTRRSSRLKHPNMADRGEAPFQQERLPTCLRRNGKQPFSVLFLGFRTRPLWPLT